MMYMTLSDIANLNIKSADYRWINSGISKNEAINYLSRVYLVVSKFLSEVPKFKENVLLCIITIIKVYDLLLTLLQLKTMLVA